MSRRIIFSVIGAGAMLVGSASEATAFELFERMLGGGCCSPGPTCGCAAEPSCGCAPSCGHGASCCGHRRGLFHGLFGGHRGCEPTCGYAADPGCGFAVDPGCGYAADPGCGYAAEPACGCAGGFGGGCCDSGCGRRHCGLLHSLFHHHRRCEPACGCASGPVCGFAG